MSAIAKIPKPKMRGLHLDYVKKSLAISLTIGMLTAIAYKFGVAERRKEAYARFYRNYDPEKAFERMKRKGVFQWA